MPDSNLRGTWVSPAYGQVLRITATQVHAYSVTSISCFRERRFPAHLGLVKLLTGASIEQSETGINLRVDGALEQIPYVRAELGEVCADPEHSRGGAMHTFDVFWTAMNEHYPFFALHGVDWEERKRLAPISDDISDEHLASILRRVTRGLDDGHILLQMGEHGLHSPSVKPA